MKQTGGRRVILLSGGPPISLKVLYCLHRLGLKTHLVDIGNISRARFSRYIYGYDRLEPAYNAGDGERLARFLKGCAPARDVAAVIPSDIASAAALYEAAAFLNDVPVFPVSSPETLEMLDDKWLFQQFMDAHGIPSPRGALIGKHEGLEDMGSRGFDFPVVLKSLHGESGHGVFVAETSEKASRYIQSGSPHARFPLLAQQYVPGLDADLSILCQAGEVKSQVLQIRRDGYILEFARNDSATDIGQRIARAASYSGVANIDLRIDEDTGEATVIECNPRFWYTLQASMWRGANFVEAGLQLAMGEDYVATETPEDGIYYLHGGLVRHVLWNPARWRTVRGYNLRGFFQALTDPMPFIRAS